MRTIRKRGGEEPRAKHTTNTESHKKAKKKENEKRRDEDSGIHIRRSSSTFTTTITITIRQLSIIYSICCHATRQVPAPHEKTLPVKGPEIASASVFGSPEASLSWVHGLGDVHATVLF